MGLPILAQQSTWDNYLEDLSKERVCEKRGLEGHRWYDLVRWDIAQKVLNGQRLHGIKIEKPVQAFFIPV
ncbi:RagB/SusD family nutrient uptake outer membrane protein [Bacteroides faecis]|uniref:RagB/SusD family nutrient uptake outer membrane protein n=1 Tax=Bacteroides faecis TaxID=674529 RepID=A0AAW5P2W9_9BACE|nr:RagB/SusD family nutrient uptake outer membrane protein [Bacteroides faecis]MCS2795088.1 RagB/SusD family nutrient uptake outer membrane protein [Bacteroides faecis]